jgi:hypothetical protein
MDDHGLSVRVGEGGLCPKAINDAMQFSCHQHKDLFKILSLINGSIQTFLIFPMPAVFSGSHGRAQ